MKFIAELRDASLFGRGAEIRALSLSVGQPLLLMRHNDKNAIRVCDLFARPLGYVAREVAAEVVPLLARGYVPECYVRSRGQRPSLLIRLQKPSEPRLVTSVRDAFERFKRGRPL